MSKMVLMAVILSSTILLTGVLLAEKPGDSVKGSAACTIGYKQCTTAAKKCPVGGKWGAGKCEAGAKPQECKVCPKKKCMKEAKAALQQVEAAKKAIEAGDKTAALAALTKIEANLQAVKTMAAQKHYKNCQKCGSDKTCPKKSTEKAARPAVVNKTCPMMGTKIDPANVPDNLYREFKGQGVAFCCGGCPDAWDKLPDEEKQAKLDKA